MPFERGFLALGAQAMGAFFMYEVGGVGASLAHHFLQAIGVVEDGARSQVVAVEWLLIVVGREERRAQRVKHVDTPNGRPCSCSSSMPC